MNIYKLSELTSEKREFIMKRAESDISEQMKIAKEVSDDIRKRGDEAVLEYTAKFDHVTLSADEMKVKPEEIEAGYERLMQKLEKQLNMPLKILEIFIQSKCLKRCGLLKWIRVFWLVKNYSYRRCLSLCSAGQGKLPVCFMYVGYTCCCCRRRKNCSCYTA